MNHMAATPATFDVAHGFVPPLARVATTQLPYGARISSITTVQGLRHLEKHWRALEANTETPATVFQSFDWVSAWCETYATGDDGADIHVLVGYAGHKLVFLWPLAVQQRWGVRLLCWLTQPFGQYGDVLCAKGEDANLWIKAALTYLKTSKAADLLWLRHVRDDAAIAPIAKAQFKSAHLHEKAPYLDLTAFASEADYENRYTGSQRKRRKKIRKALEDMGPVSFTALPPGAPRESAIAEALAEKNKWLGGRGRINVAIGCPRHRAFLNRLASGASDALQMSLTEIKAGDRPISWEISFRFGGTHYAYITSHVNALTDLSPGRLHFDLSQRACLADGLKTYDLMVPYDPHKESWSSGMVAVDDYFMPLSRRGRLAGFGYMDLMRPLLRKAYYRMPKSLLKLINREKTSGPDKAAD
jgi:CelD/BcsL family acetyltransferase involved in cellulose biosynthesis